ncbi:hypothetical protein ROS1_47480 [Roseibium sp. ROS1]
MDRQCQKCEKADMDDLVIGVADAGVEHKAGQHAEGHQGEQGQHAAQGNVEIVAVDMHLNETGKLETQDWKFCHGNKPD